jgi:HAD superfamily hydrolase (TIGR01490 family)
MSDGRLGGDASSLAAVAIFDLDGTITRRDTFAAFLLRYLRRHPQRWPRCLPLLALAPLFLCGLIGNTRMKVAALRAVCGGAERAEMTNFSEDFADRCMATLLRAQALARIAAHRQAGDLLVLATASPDVYVEALARRLGFDRVVATAVGWTPEGRMTGGLAGDNLRGAAKLAAVQHLLSAVTPARTVAYSDSDADLPLLRWADRAVAVNPTRRLAEIAAAEGFTIEDWN